ncbi:cytochrome P450 [Mycolicibacterium sarraceniae]|uniref:Uncharacterized protein n=1 Tax=Mycolicibacterium sarraceniae TaxID=1534348 RepID=A0A7I7SLG6_9MYCO|nr:cytochrome P450 [Mycolicibacterium sarraceniae]BBY57834.1 hypothetical protein MSAR_09700 [Mycolicibacterium sarraceniae]
MPQWDWGHLSPWGRFDQYRREYDRIADELIRWCTAGHETTATTLAWAVERHPALHRCRVRVQGDAGGAADSAAGLRDQAVESAGQRCAVARHGPDARITLR